MSDPEFKEKHSKRLKDKHLKSRQNDFKGAFKIKEVDARRETYKRSKLRVSDIHEINED